MDEQATSHADQTITDESESTAQTQTLSQTPPQIQTQTDPISYETLLSQLGLPVELAQQLKEGRQEALTDIKEQLQSIIDVKVQENVDARFRSQSHIPKTMPPVFCETLEDAVAQALRM